MLKEPEGGESGEDALPLEVDVCEPQKDPVIRQILETDEHESQYFQPIAQ